MATNEDMRLAWLIEHAGEITEKYHGMWIAIVADAVVGKGATAREAHDSALAQCGVNARPLLTFVEESADVILSGSPLQLSGILPGALQAYVHNLHVRLGDIEMTAPVAFPTEESLLNLLGRAGIFHALTVEFSGHHRMTTFRYGGLV